MVTLPPEMARELMVSAKPPVKLKEPEELMVTRDVSGITLEPLSCKMSVPEPSPMISGPLNAAMPVDLLRNKLPALMVNGPVKVLLAKPLNVRFPRPSLVSPPPPLIDPVRNDPLTGVVKVSRLAPAEMLLEMERLPELAAQVWGPLRMMLVLLRV